MLVLSRRQNEKIVFPNVGISIEVVRIAGNTVRIGVDAPASIRVLREEVAESSEPTPDVPSPLGRRMRHALRNRLNTAALALQVLQRKVEAGTSDDVTPLIYKVLQELEEIELQLDGERHEDRGQRPVKNRRALIVEDNANEGQLLAEYLRISGYDVDLVDNGSKAIAYLKTNPHPDVVLMDMCMPELDGPQTILSIRCEPKWHGLRLFAVSGADQRELGIKSGPAGVDRWFSKPVDASTLVREMNRELDNSLIPA